MKKSSFLTLATILLATIAMPTVCMDNPLELSETPAVFIKLHLRKVTQSEISDSWNKSLNKEDKHACKVLGIQWEKNTNNYWVDKALYRRLGDMQDFCDWRHCPHPQGLPLTTIPNPALTEGTEYSLQAPTSLPAGFVQELQKKGSIILENGSFKTPIKIVFELGSIKNDTEESQIPSKLRTYFTAYGPKIAIAGIFGYLMYLCVTNQSAKFILITDFIRNLAKLKNN